MEVVSTLVGASVCTVAFYSSGLVVVGTCSTILQSDLRLVLVIQIFNFKISLHCLNDITGFWGFGEEKVIFVRDVSRVIGGN